jgi:hypothetical protein
MSVGAVTARFARRATDRVDAADTTTTWSWGRLPELSLTVAFGLALVASGNALARDGSGLAELAFYGGLLLLVLPIGLRLLMPAADGTERVSLVVLLAIGLFLCKFVHDPLSFGGYDEFLHWRTAQDLAQTGQALTPNTLFSVSTYYPGLELATNALSSVSGIPIFESGVILLIAARVVFVMALFFFLAMVSGSTRVAGIACLVYMANPKFLYFNSQFSYESLALPLAALVLYLLARRGHSGPARWIGFTVIGLVTLPAVVITHHVTSAMLAAFLVLWAITGFVLRRRDRAKPGRAALLTVGLIGVWVLFVATVTIGYLGPAITSTLSEVAKLVAGDAGARDLFVSPSGDVAPLWERLVGSASAGVILVLLPLGLFVVWRRYRSNAAVVALALAAVAYPLTLLARLTTIGAEVSGRTPEFLFIGIGLVLALALVRLTYTGTRGKLQIAAVLGILAVLVVGGVIVGLPRWARLPGPYLVSADGRSVETQGIAAAEWTRDYLGPGNVVVADRVNRLLMADYGQQKIVSTYETKIPVRRLYLAAGVGREQREIVTEGKIRYLVVDRRLSSTPPVVGNYFDRGEGRLTGGSDEALDPAILAKWDQQPDVSRVFDSGDIQLYDVSGLAQPR